MDTFLRMRLIPVFILLSSFLSMKGQGLPIAIGQWRDHTPFIKAIEVADAGGKIFCASKFGLFSYDKNDGGLSTFTRLNSLSDFELAGARYDSETDYLLVSYENSNIDLIKVSTLEVFNIPDIKRKNIVGGKRINAVTFIDRKAYLGTDFGIVVVDLDKKEVKDTYYIGPGGTNVIVYGIAYNGTQLLAATASGMFSATLSDPNIFNYTGWQQEAAGLNLPGEKYSSCTSYQGVFYSVLSKDGSNSDTVLVKDNGSWRIFINDFAPGYNADSSHGRLLLRSAYRISAYDATLQVSRFVSGSSYNPSKIMDGFLDNNDIFWVADFKNGLVKRTFNPTATAFISPSGPFSEAVWSMESRGGTLWVASGSLSGDAPIYDPKTGCYVLNDNRWTSFNYDNDSLYNAVNLPAMVAVAVDPNDPGHAFFGNWRAGVLEYDLQGGIRQYDESNSTMLSRNGLADYILAGGIAFDQDNVMWVAAGTNTRPINARYPDGTWQSFLIPDGAVSNFQLYQVLIDDFGTKWVIAREGASTGQGLIVFNENDRNNTNDDSFRRLNDRSGSGGLPDMYVRCMAKDKDGSIWIGTNKGVAVFYNPGDVFSSTGFDAQRVIIEQDGYAQYLLESEYVTAVAIDGANRKWFGTYGGGVFLLSEDGTKQFLNFNSGNSPLPSNNVVCITIDDLTGEVFIGTEKGIVSYRSDATTGGQTCNDHYAFPNPVKHDYHGPIAVRGLVDDADVRITDAAGNIVFRTKALGGQAVWDGNDFSGRRATTGIYYVQATNPDGTATCVSKLLMAR
ncbi:MAG: two-component regulator propeller domain-containing protein [Bacteroidota bacterium]